MNRAFPLAFALFFLVKPVLGQAPNVTHLLPAGVPPGKPVEVTFFGERLEGAVGLWSSFAASASSIAQTGRTGQAAFRIEMPRGSPPGIGAVRLIATNGVSGWHLLMSDDLPGTVSCGTNKSMAAAQELKLPVAVDGACEALRSDFYRFAARKGQRIAVEVVAQRMGSALDPFVRLLDAAGRELVWVEDTPGAGADARFTHRFAASGTYFIEIRDTTYEGGPKHRYRLRAGNFSLTPLPFLADRDQFPRIDNCAVAGTLSEREPNDVPEKAQRLENTPVVIAGNFARAGDRDFYEFTATKGERVVFRGHTRSLGSACDLFMQIQDTNGSKVAEANVTGADEGTVTNTFERDGRYRLLVEELNRGGGPGFDYRIFVEPLPPGFALSVEADLVSAPPGSDFEIFVSATRRDYDGPIHLSLAGLPGDLALTNAIIPAKTNAVKLRATVPDDLELGQLVFFAVLGQAEIKGKNFAARASTMPALRSRFPEMLWPPEALDGWIALGVATSKSEATEPKPKRKKK